MTIREFLINKVNEYIARQLWTKISTELDTKVMKTKELADEHKRFPWMIKRIDDLLDEYVPVEKKKKQEHKEEVVNEEKAKDSMGDSSGDPA